MTTGQEIHWRIVKIETVTPRVKNFYLEPVDAEKPAFIAGQYLTVKLGGQSPAEGKAYSISSAPYEPHIRLSIKQIGDYSTHLLAHTVGDILTTTKPYGFFYPEPTEARPLVFVVGGIGITPCLSIIKNLTAKSDTREIQLHYSNQAEIDIAFRDELTELATRHKPLRVQYYVTREKPTDNTVQFGRLQAAAIVRSVSLVNDPEFFICGAMDFTKSLWKELRAAGIPQHQLYTEGFF